MGTRADFYVGRGKDARWLGSHAYDGHPESVLAGPIGDSRSPEDFERAVAAHLAVLDDATVPEQGWPWPWKDSHTTDYAYAFDGEVFCCRFGREWMTVAEALDQDREGVIGDLKDTTFPDMTDRQKVTYGPRSGVLVFGIPKD